LPDAIDFVTGRETSYELHPERAPRPSGTFSRVPAPLMAAGAN